MSNFTDIVVNLSGFELGTLIMLILMQVVSVLSNILILVVIVKARHLSTGHKLTRQRILMTNIAFCALLVIFEASLPFFILVPILIGVSSTLIMVIESIGSYLDALSMYALSITMTLISCDQYFLLINVFCAPLNKMSTKWIMISIWFFSAIVSIPFMIKNEVYYFDYSHRSFICSYMTYDNWLQVLSENHQFVMASTIFRLVLEYIIPAVTIFCFSLLVVIKFLCNRFGESGPDSRRSGTVNPFRARSLFIRLKWILRDKHGHIRLKLVISKLLVE